MADEDCFAETGVTPLLEYLGTGPDLDPPWQVWVGRSDVEASLGYPSDLVEHAVDAIPVRFLERAAPNLIRITNDGRQAIKRHLAEIQARNVNDNR